VRSPKKKLSYTFSLSLCADGRKIFDEDGVQLLRGVEETGTIKGAAKELKISWMFAWNCLLRMKETLHQPVVVTRRGGMRSKHRGGGGTVLTPLAKDLLKQFRETELLMQQTLSKQRRRTQLARHL
jgi:molybdate transport system regulatory protein